MMAAKKEKEETQKGETFGDDPNAPRPMGQMPVVIHSQYIKDLSFENPKSPMSLRGTGEKPALDISFSMDAQKIDFEVPGSERDVYEVTLGVTVKATRGDDIAFLAQVEYGVTCTVGEGVPEERVHPLLLIEMPRHAFPFVRQIVANVTQQAGFLPVMLTPVDFRSFYMQRYGQPDGAPQETASA